MWSMVSREGGLTGGAIGNLKKRNNDSGPEEENSLIGTRAKARDCDQQQAFLSPKAGEKLENDVRNTLYVYRRIAKRTADVCCRSLGRKILREKRSSAVCGADIETLRQSTLRPSGTPLQSLWERCDC